MSCQHGNWPPCEYCDEIETNLAELQRENARLVGCLTQANHNAEEFERKWYIAGDERDAEKARATELQREVEGLRAEVAELRTKASEHRDGRLAALERAERLAGALRERRDWFEAQAKSISKGNGSSWDLMQVREQRDLCDAALDQETTNG